MADEAPEPTPEGIPVPPQTPLYHALEQPRYSRQQQRRAIEERTGRRLICYVAGPATTISAVDIPAFVDVLHDVEPGSDLDLRLHTPGGDVDQAERMVLLCRKRVGHGSFRVVVPNSAKSAGTLSAAYFPLLDKLDPALIDFCRKALLRSEQFAETFLAKHMLKDDPEQAKQVAHELNDVKKHLSHGAVIDAERAIEMGLKVELLRHDDDLWQAYWRLFCAQLLALANPSMRLYEGRKASLISSG